MTVEMNVVRARHVGGPRALLPSGEQPGRQRLAVGLFALLLVLGALCFSGFAWASADCPPVPPEVPASFDARIALLRELDRRAGTCGLSADWYSLKGALLLANGQVAEAAENLERALLLAPDHAAARVDYADALAELGDVPSARALGEELLALSDLPAPARAHLEARMRAWGGGELERWKTQFELGMQVGWESNLNGGPAADTVLLTPPGGVVSLPLDRSQAPEEGGAGMLELKGRAFRPIGDNWQLVLGGQVKARDAAGGRNDYTLTQLDVSLLKERPQGDFIAQFGFTDQSLGHRALLQEERIGGVYQWAGQPCRPRVGTDVIQRSYPSAPVLNGRQLGLRAGLLCSGADWYADAALRYASDWATRGERPGGRQNWLELSLSGAQQWGGNTFRSELAYARIGDREGYSALLADNASRQVTRYALRFEMLHPVASRWDASLGLEYFNQRSNIDLFQLDNLGVYVGLRYRH